MWVFYFRDLIIILLRKKSINNLKSSYFFRVKLLTLFFWIAACDSSVVEPENSFFKLYGGGRIQQAVDIEVSDDRIILLGRSNSFSGEDDDLYAAMLINTDLDGTQKWFLLIEGDGVTSPKVLEKDSNGDFFVAGSTRSIGFSQSNLLLAKVTSEGVLLWEKSFASSLGSAEVVDISLAASQIKVLGRAIRSDQTSYFFVQDFDMATGEPISVPTVFLNNPNEESFDDFPSRIFPLGENYVIIGNTSERSISGEGVFTGTNIRILEYNSNKLVSFSGVFGENGNDVIQDVIRLEGGTFLVLGYQQIGTLNRSGFIAAFSGRTNPQLPPKDSDYQPKWRVMATDILGSPNNDSEFVSATELPSGAVRVLINFSGTNNERKDLRVFEIDAGGKVLNPNVITFGGEGDDRGVKIIHTNQSEGYVFGELDYQNDNTLLSLQKINF